MLLGEYLPTSCSTDGVKGLTMQVADILKTRMAAEIVDISAHVEIVGPTTIPFLQTAAGNALIAAINKKGEKPRLVHAIRVLPQQYAVHYWITHGMGKRCGVTMAAAPGTSPHERGIAIDVENHGHWIDVLRQFNWVWRGDPDPPHFNFHGGGDPDFGMRGIEAFQTLWNKNNPDDQIKVDGLYGPNTQKRLEASRIEGF